MRTGRPPFKPTDADREMVTTLCKVGIPQDQIAQVIGGGINFKTLAKHFATELREAKTIANGKVGGRLFDKAMEGDTSAMIWWTKTQMGWRETTVNENTGTVVVNISRDDAKL